MRWSQREFLTSTAGTLGAAVLTGATGLRSAASNVPVGVQVYCFRHVLEQEFEGTREQTATLGYDGVQFARYYYSGADVTRLPSGRGLAPCGAHVGIELLLGNKLQQSIDFHGELSNTRLIVPAIGNDRRAPLDTLMRTTEELTDIQEALRPHGMNTGYYCHKYSFNTPL